MQPIISIENLSVHFREKNGNISALSDVSLQIYPGKMLALVGESGSGKSVTALAILQLLPENIQMSGRILFTEPSHKSVNLLAVSQKTIRTYRGVKIGMIFQEPMTSLNPVLTCGYQVMESLRVHRKMTRAAARQKTEDLFTDVGLPEPAAMRRRYPHQLSGGQKQRVMIAIAIACEPQILIADEPTTALDVNVQQNILELLRSLQIKKNLSVLLITHDLGIVADYADDIAVMRHGTIVEKGLAKDLLARPIHDYTKALLACRPAIAVKGERLPVLSDFLMGDKIRSISLGYEKTRPSTNVLIDVQSLSVRFPSRKNFLNRPIVWRHAVEDVSFQIYQGEVLGIVGESGCGKTTLGRALLQLVMPSKGKILVNGAELISLAPTQLRRERKDLQIVFQDPYGSLNPRLSIGEAILEPMKVHRMHKNDRCRREKVVELLEKVELGGDHFARYPHQFSGGQRQRICIARALASEPSFIVFDESVSALDVSVQSQILNLINDLKQNYHFTAVFITHDLAVVHYISDRIMVMNNGKIVEIGNADQIINDPENIYTQRLLKAIPGRSLNFNVN